MAPNLLEHTGFLCGYHLKPCLPYPCHFSFATSFYSYFYEALSALILDSLKHLCAINIFSDIQALSKIANAQETNCQ